MVTNFDSVDNPGALIGDRVEVDDPVCGEHQELVPPGGSGVEHHLLDPRLLTQPTRQRQSWSSYP